MYLTETQNQHKSLSQQTNCNHDKHQNSCSIKSALQLSNTLEAHIASTDDCIDEIYEIYEDTEGSIYDDNIDGYTNLLIV